MKFSVNQRVSTRFTQEKKWNNKVKEWISKINAKKKMTCSLKTQRKSSKKNKRAHMKYNKTKQLSYGLDTIKKNIKGVD